jgi:hypothetical protein
VKLSDQELFIYRDTDIVARVEWLLNSFIIISATNS